MSRILSALRKSEIRRRETASAYTSVAFPSTTPMRSWRARMRFFMLASFMSFVGIAAFYYLADGPSASLSTTGAMQQEPRSPGHPGNTLTGSHLAHLPVLENLNVDVLVFNEKPALRFVLVNMQRFGEGDVIGPETRIEEITASGIVVSHKGALLRFAPRTY